MAGNGARLSWPLLAVLETVGVLMEFELWENEAIEAFFLSYKPRPTASVKTEVFDSEEERESVIEEIEEDYRAWLAA